MGRWIGIDYGTRRIGLALADPGGRLASPAQTLDSVGSAPGDARRVLAWAADNEAAGFVVGLPLNMDGTDSDQTRLTRRFAEALRTAGPLPVELWDERLSSFQADEWLAAGQVRPSRRKYRRDALAAQVILQSFLEARRRAAEPSEEPPAGDDSANA
jgi:putative Holliday junction resolvase